MSRFLSLIVILFSALCWATSAQCEELKPGETRELRMSLDDRFIIRGTDQWKIDVQNAMPLRSADVCAIPKQGTDWSIALRFLCDTPDIARFDTPEKMRAAVTRLATQKAFRAVEKEPEIKRWDIGGQYGYGVTLTDRFLTEQKELQAGEFRYMTMGMLRLSKDSAMSFVIYCNDLTSKAYMGAVAYVTGFVKPVDDTLSR